MPIIRFLYILIVLFFPFSECWANRSWEEVVGGAPASLGKKLPAESFVEVKAQRLKKAKLLWFNFDLARQIGLEIPAQGMTPEFEQKVLEALAYNIPRPGIDDHEFYPIQKTFYADRYGGNGMAASYGSGRAAIAGEIQIKGIGITPLVGNNYNFDHAHGGASIKEAISEAIWGEINHRELPFGGNRVLAVIDTGTFTYWNDGGKEARALIVREDPLRPAHFALVPREGRNATLLALDLKRVEKVSEFILKVLPGLEQTQGLSPSAQIKLGLETMVDRWAQQFAAMYARRLLQGATSSSNIEINGKLLDYGTQTALADWGKAKALTHTPPFGVEFDRHITQSYVLMKNGLKEYLPGKLFYAMPRVDAMQSFAQERFKKYIGQEMSALCGFPPELLARVKNSTALKSLGELLYVLSNTGTEEILVDKIMPKKMGVYDVEKIIGDLVQLRSDEKTIPTKLLAQVPQARKEELAKSYRQLLAEIESLAEVDGVGKEALNIYLQQQSSLRLRQMKELYRPDLHQASIALVDRYQVEKDPRSIGQFIEEKIAKGQRTFKLPQYQTMVAQEVEDLGHGLSQIIYDAKKGSYFYQYHLIQREKDVIFFGHSIPVSQFEKSWLRYSTDQWASMKEVQPIKKGKKFIVEIPLAHDTHEIKFALRAENSEQWWKASTGDLHFTIYRSLNLPTNSCWGKVDLVLNSL